MESPAHTRAIRQALCSAALALGGTVEGRSVFYTRNGQDFRCYLSEFDDTPLLRKHIEHIESGAEVDGFLPWLELSFTLDRYLTQLFPLTIH